MEYIAHIATMAGIYVILVVGLNLAVGYAGIPAMGQSAFLCIGAYASTLLSLNAGVSPWVSLLAACLLAGAAGWLMIATVSRLSGDFLALATFAFAVIAHSVASNWTSMTRGPMGIPGIPPFQVFGYAMHTAWAFLPLVIVASAGTVWVAVRLVHSPFGRVLQGIRESEIVTMSLGRDVRVLKQKVFVVAACLAGLAGALYAHYISYIDPSSFTALESITILLMVVFGGLGSISGSVLGACVLVLLPELLRFIGLPDALAAPMRQMLYGAALVVLMVLRPNGLLGRFRWN